MVWSYIAALVFLIPCTVWDVKTREIPALWLVVCGIASVMIAVWSVMTGGEGIADIVLALSPGLFLIALAIVTEHQIGLADGISGSILGLCLGSPAIYMVLMAALLLSSGYAAVLLISHKGSRHSRMPWIPFLAAGVIAVWILNGGAIG